MASCPTIDQLERFIDQGRSDAALSGHLKACRDCAAAADRIAANNRLLAEMRDGGLDTVTLDRSTTAPVRVEGYRILGEIHRGGQGVVYKAEQIATRRTAALKFLHGGFAASSDGLRRFQREIEVAAGLEHPNIVTVFQSGVTDDGQRYCSMEFVDGVPLDRHVESLRVNAEVPPKGSEQRSLRMRERAKIVELMIKVCDVVNYAHQRGVLHRDLKPDNILVDSSGEPRVLDFGLGKTIDSDAGGEASLVTMPGVFLGTPAYASPEQAAADAKLVDIRSDIYSIGVILYRLLTGRFPYPVEGKVHEVLRSIAERGAASPAPQVQGDLATIVMKCLTKDPARRYQTAGVLRDELSRFLVGDPIQARGDSTWYVLRKIVVRHRTLCAAAAVILALLVGGTITVALLGLKARREADRATFEKEESDIVAGLLRKAILTSIHQIDPAQPANLGTVLDWISTDLKARCEGHPILELEMRDWLQTAYKGVEDYEAAAAQARRTVEIQQGTASLDDGQRARGHHRLARRLHRAIRARLRCIPLAAHPDGELVLVVRDSGKVSQVTELSKEDSAALVEAAACALKAWQGRVQALGPEDSRTVNSRIGRALILLDLGQYHDAEEVFKTVLGPARRATDEPKALTKTLAGLSELLALQGRYAEALPYLEELVGVRANLNEEPDIDVVVARNNLGVTLWKLDRAHESAQLLASSCADLSKIPDVSPEIAALIRDNFGSVSKSVDR